MLRRIIISALIAITIQSGCWASSFIPGILTTSGEVVHKNLTVEGYYYGNGSKLIGISASNENTFVKKAGDRMTGNLTVDATVKGKVVESNSMFIRNDDIATGAAYLDAFEIQLNPTMESNLTARSIISTDKAMGTDVGFLARIIDTGVSLGGDNNDEIIFDNPYENLKSYLGEQHTVLGLLLHVYIAGIRITGTGTFDGLYLISDIDGNKAKVSDLNGNTPVFDGSVGRGDLLELCYINNAGGGFHVGGMNIATSFVNTPVGTHPLAALVAVAKGNALGNITIAEEWTAQWLINNSNNNPTLSILNLNPDGVMMGSFLVDPPTTTGWGWQSNFPNLTTGGVMDFGIPRNDETWIKFEDNPHQWNSTTYFNLGAGELFYDANAQYNINSGNGKIPVKIQANNSDIFTISNVGDVRVAMPDGTIPAVSHNRLAVGGEYDGSILTYPADCFSASIVGQAKNDGSAPYGYFGVVGLCDTDRNNQEIAAGAFIAKGPNSYPLFGGGGTDDNPVYDLLYFEGSASNWGIDVNNHGGGGGGAHVYLGINGPVLQAEASSGPILQVNADNENGDNVTIVGTLNVGSGQLVFDNGTGVTTGTFAGDGSGLYNITLDHANYADAAGTAESATWADFSGVASSAAYSEFSGTATLAAWADLSGTASFAAGAAPGQAFYAPSGITAEGDIRAGYFYGDGSHLTNILTTEVGYATEAGHALTASEAAYSILSAYASGAAYADLSGYATAAGTSDMAGYASLSGLATSAGTANDLSIAGQTTGDLLYFDGNWTRFPADGDGLVLTSRGAGMVPSWESIPGTGTVTRIDSGIGLTGGPITTSGTFDVVYAPYAIVAGSASTAAYSTLSGTSTLAGYAELAGVATDASFALLSGVASLAAYSNYSGVASAAAGAVPGQVFMAGSGAIVTGNCTADYLYGDGSHLTNIATTSVDYAGHSGYAGLAGTATNAGYAILAASASTAAIANYATLSGQATTAASADYAGWTGYAVLSGTASTCTGSAASASFATMAGSATTAGYSDTSGVASRSAYATLAGVATTAGYAASAGTAGTATLANSALTAGTANSANTANTATTALYAGGSIAGQIFQCPTGAFFSGPITIEGSGTVDFKNASHVVVGRFNLATGSLEITGTITEGKTF